MAGARVVLADLRMRLGAVAALEGLSLTIEAGERVAVFGPSGSGKTTLLRLVAGLEVPDGGEVLLDGARASGPGSIDVPPERRGVALLFQDLALWPHLTVAQTLALVAPPAEGTARRQAAAELAARVGLGGRLGALPGELSGGERQRLALARAAAQRPRLLLLDEPFAHVDRARARRLRDALLAGEFGMEGATLLLVTHDREDAFALGERVAVVERGRLLQCAPPAELCARPASARVAELLDLGTVVRARAVREGVAQGELLGELPVAPAAPGAAPAPGAAGLLLLRRSALRLRPAPPGSPGTPVCASFPAGRAWTIRLRLRDGTPLEAYADAPFPAGATVTIDFVESASWLPARESAGQGTGSE